MGEEFWMLGGIRRGEGSLVVCMYSICEVGEIGDLFMMYFRDSEVGDFD